MTPTNYTKHTSNNPIQKILIERFYTKLLNMVEKIQPKRILDAGCGEGFSLHRLQLKNLGSDNVGIDFSAESVNLAHSTYPELKIQQGDIYHLPFKDNSFDLVLCNEVLEHLEDPEAAVKELRRVSSKYVLFSVPNEPFFILSNLLRGKYLKTFGNHPEHINHWTVFSFPNFLKQNNFKVNSIKFPFAWILALSRKNKNE